MLKVEHHSLHMIDAGKVFLVHGKVESSFSLGRIRENPMAWVAFNWTEKYRYLATYSWWERIRIKGNKEWLRETRKLFGQIQTKESWPWSDITSNGLIHTLFESETPWNALQDLMLWTLVLTWWHYFWRFWKILEVRLAGRSRPLRAGLRKLFLVSFPASLSFWWEQTPPHALSCSATPTWAR